MHAITHFIRWTMGTRRRFIWIWGVLGWALPVSMAVSFLSPELPSWYLIIWCLFVFGIGGYLFGWVMWVRRNEFRRVERPPWVISSFYIIYSLAVIGLIVVYGRASFSEWVTPLFWLILLIVSIDELVTRWRRSHPPGSSQ